MYEADNEWQTFSVDSDGEVNVLWEFNGNDILCNDGYYYRAFELWNYDSADSGKGDGGKTEDVGAMVDSLYKYFEVDPMTEFFNMDTSLFGSSYEEFRKKIGRSDLMQP